MTDTRDCVTVREMLSAFLDGESPPEQAREIARHLAGCATCSAEFEEMKQMSAATREHLHPTTAPDVLRARVRAALRSAQQTPVPSTSAPRRPWPRQLVAGIAIAITSSALTVGVMKFQPTRTESVANQVLATHVHALMTSHLTDVTSNDQHNVKPWFNGKVDFSPEVVRLDSIGFPLTGGRVDLVGKQPVAAIVYARRLHVINVFTWPSASATVSDSVAAARGYNALHWTHAGMTFWAVSDLNVAELREFVSAFRRGAA